MKKLLLFFVPLFLSSFLAAQKPYVLLVSYDAFRWDYLDRNLTPHMTSFYEEGVRALSFRPAFPSKTFPNHLSIITGMYPENHGIITNDFENPFTDETYKLSDRAALRNSEWYLGEPFWETLKRHGVKTASFYWPSSSVEDSSYSPDIYKLYDPNVPYDARVDTVISWLRMPYDKRPHFITLYYSETDTYGHRYGPNSQGVNNAIMDMDNVTGYLIASLKKINMYDSVNVIILSDHGMTEISPEKIINVQKILRGYDVEYSNVGPLMMIEPRKGETEKIYEILKKNEKHFVVYKKEDVPEFYHFSHNDFIYPLVLIADLGWSLTDDKSEKMFTDKYGDNKGNHGYDNHALDMHGIFIARGPAFKKNYKTGTLWNIDVYPLLCKIFNITPRSNIDGKLERIGFILKEKK